MKNNEILKKENYPRSNELYNSIVSLPIYPALKDKEIDYIIYTIKEIFHQNSV